jgi:transcriptional regulator with XRE-family HTH domain
MAFKLGISQNAYSKLELGYSKLSVDVLYHLAEILNTDIRTLMAEDQ